MELLNIHCRLDGSCLFKYWSDNLSAKTEEYIKMSIIILIIIMLIFVFNLPKSILFNLVIVTIVFIFYNELFPQKNKGGREKEYITAILFFLIFAGFTYFFDLPKKLYIVIGILAVSLIILYELFNFIGDKEE